MPINVKDTINGSNFSGTVNGYSIAKSVPSNAVFTDTNTWRPVVDNLTSTATDQSLSANQGRALKALVDGKAATSHGTHVTYGTSTTALTSGGTGVVGSSTTLARADHTHTLPAYPTALKSPGALTISLNGTSQGAYDGSAAKSINITADSVGAAPSSHTHTTVGSYMGVSNTTGSNGYGISLYGGATAGAPSYGLMFQQTGTWGTHGAVTSDWATYFTMAGSTSRGWIFKAGNSTGGNVASISATGVITAASFSGPLSGNASSATKLATARTINGVSFDGSANITISAAANGGTSAACSGNSATATKLATARTINGTNFDGTAAITTANWGTARTITIGSTGKSVNGSANVSWTLAEIGAAAASHGTHISDTGWKDFTLASGVSLATGGVARYRKINNIVYVEINAIGLSHSGNGATAVAKTITTLPSGYRPSAYIPFDATTGSTQPNPCRMECNTDGTIKFRSSLNTMTTSYPIHISFSFMI